MITKYDPEIWLESLTRALKDYVGDAFNKAVLDSSSSPIGLYDKNTNPEGIYEVVMEFPAWVGTRDKVPLPRSIIHFEIDAIDDMPVGIGQNIGQENFDLSSQTVNPQEAKKHLVNFDVGIWTSDTSGGTTARLRARQILTNVLYGSLAQSALDNATNNGDGRIEILRYTGGRFITEHLNDIATYRAVDSALEVRVFSRTPLSTVPSPAIEEVLQSPGLTIAP